MHWILIATTGDQKHLLETLASINCLQTKHAYKVVISIYCSAEVPKIEEWEVRRREQPLFQFDQYALLAQELPIAKEDKVVLLDDDDLLLPWALEEEGSFVGLHVLAEDALTSDLLKIMQKDSTAIQEVVTKAIKQRIVDDFSGTTTSGDYFLSYFQQRKPRIKSLEDTDYMNYIETLPDLVGLKRPVVIHRLKDQPSLWMKRLKEEVLGK